MAPTPPSLSLEGKVAIISGSGRENGIGAGIAIALAQAGARVTLNYVSDTTAPRAASVVEKIEGIAGKGSVIAVQADVSTLDGVKKLVSETLKGFGVDQIDILVNNAYAGTVSPAMSMSPEDILHTFGVCVFGPIYLMQAAYPHMTRGGRIINIGSEASRLGNVPIYSAVKAAMDSLTFSLSKELGRDGKGITINSVLPGPVVTDALAKVPKEMIDLGIEMARAEARVGTIEDIADSVLLLVSEKSRWITGQVIAVSGGITGG